MLPFRIKICGVRTADDVAAVNAARPDAAGFLVGRRHVSPDFVSADVAVALSRDLDRSVTPVLVTHLETAAAVTALLERTGFRAVQCHGRTPAAELCELRKRCGREVLIVAAVHVVGGELAMDWRALTEWVDGFVLDTADPETDRVGGTGTPHDWMVSARFVRDCRLPVILAGGLKPENVASAVQTVRPYGVDANTGLDAPRGRKSVERCCAFVRAARTALGSV